jgi:hypothetical protein
MTLKDYLRSKKLKQLKISKDTGISPTKLNLFINSWSHLHEFELELLSKYLNISKKDIAANNIKEK